MTIDDSLARFPFCRHRYTVDVIDVARAMTLVCCVALGSCAPNADTRPAPRAGESPFRPATIRIHPLTRLDYDDQGRGQIVFHLETKDHWGDTTKTIGLLSVQLLRPAEGLLAGTEVQETVWEVDLYDLDLNARLFDPATRTYRIPLGQLPGWVEQMIEPSQAGRLGLRAVLTLAAGRPGELFLKDEFIIER